jgi:hypothetical protein
MAIPKPAAWRNGRRIEKRAARMRQSLKARFDDHDQHRLAAVVS